MICEYTIYDTADMYMKTAFPIHEKGDMYMKTPNRIYVSCHIDTLHKIENEWHKKKEIKITTKKENCKCMIINTSFFFLLFR